MVVRRPLVIISGQQTELPPGDTLLSTSIGSLTVFSGLTGGGDLSGNTTTFVNVSAEPSGVIVVGDKLALDGAALRRGQAALASGVYALEVGDQALNSGVIANIVANAALASGNAVLTAIPQIPNGVLKTFTAAGGIEPGYAVGLDETGSVQAVGVVKDLNSRYTAGTTVIDSRVIYEQAIASISGTNNFLGVIRADSNYGFSYVASVSGSNIYNTVPTVIDSTYTGNPVLSYDDTNQRYCFVYLRYIAPNYRPAVRSVTVSGSDLFFGDIVNIDATAQSNRHSLDYVPDQDNFIFVWNDTSNNLYANVLTASGSTYVPGTRFTVNAGANLYSSVVYDPVNKKAVVAYQEVTTLYGAAKLLTVSGTTITAGTSSIFQSATCTYLKTAFDPVNTKTFIGYGAASKGYVVVGTAEAANLAVGTPVQYTDVALTEPPAMSYDVGDDCCVLSYRYSNTQGRSIPVFSSGYVLTAGSESTFIVNNVDLVQSTYSLDVDRVYVAYRNVTSGTRAYAVTSAESYYYTPLINNQNNYIGIAQNAAVSGGSVSVRLPGSYETLVSGLTTGSIYYVDPPSSGIVASGTQSAAWSGDLSWGYIGKAMNSNVLLLTDMI